MFGIPCVAHQAARRYGVFQYDVSARNAFDNTRERFVMAIVCGVYGGKSADIVAEKLLGRAAVRFCMQVRRGNGEGGICVAGVEKGIVFHGTLLMVVAIVYMR